MAGVPDLLSKARFFVEEWSHSQLKQLENTTHVHTRITNADEERVKELEAREKRALEESAKRTTELETEKRFLYEAQHDIMAMRETREAVEGVQQPLQTEEASLRTHLAQLSKDLEMGVGGFKETERDLRYHTDMYAERLGMGVKRLTDHRLCFEFTKIDPSNPTRIFSFVLFLNEEGEYCVENMDPYTTAMDALQHTLYHTNDLTGFLVAMRRAFKTLCTEEM